MTNLPEIFSCYFINVNSMRLKKSLERCQKAAVYVERATRPDRNLLLNIEERKRETFAWKS